jgi:hypothetical protein
VVYTSYMAVSKNKKGKLLRIERTLLERLEAWAEEDGRSANNLMAHLLKQAVDRRDQEMSERNSAAA